MKGQDLFHTVRSVHGVGFDVQVLESRHGRWSIETFPEWFFSSWLDDQLLVSEEGLCNAEYVRCPEQKGSAYEARLPDNT